MNTCLSNSELAKLLAGDGGPEFLREGFAHVRSCPKCHAEAMEQSSFARAAESLEARAAEITPCLDYARLARFLAGTLPESERAAADRHLAECASCAADLDFIATLDAKAQLRPHRAYAPQAAPRKSLWSFRASNLGWALAAAAVLVGVIAGPRLIAPPQDEIARRPNQQTAQGPRDQNAIAVLGVDSAKPGGFAQAELAPGGDHGRLQYTLRTAGWVYVYSRDSLGRLSHIGMPPGAAGVRTTVTQFATPTGKEALYLVYSATPWKAANTVKARDLDALANQPPTEQLTCIRFTAKH